MDSLPSRTATADNVHPPPIDDNGNTIFHEICLSLGYSADTLEGISQQGVDINQPNHMGRTPLHVICSVGWYNARSCRPRLLWMLERIQNVDAADIDGIRPLHMASMMSEYLTKELLAHGADPTAPTLEGLTALHLAARARQSNIVGMLIGSIRSQNPTKFATLLDARDQVGQSPLFYACRSGRHETVALLLGAGADPEVQDKDGMTLLDACAGFEEEQDLWAEYRKPTGFEVDQLANLNRPTEGVSIGGTKIQDTLRPFVATGRLVNEWLGRRPIIQIRSDQDTTRLEEILQMLLDSADKRGKDAVNRLYSALCRCIQRCGSDARVYTLRCLKEFEARLAGMLNPQLVPIDKGISVQGFISLHVVEQHLVMREYDVIEDLLGHGSCSGTMKAMETGKILRLLVQYGFSDLLGRLLRSEDPPNTKMSELVEPRDPLLVVACQRQLPNMDIVRLLVEQGHVDLNAKTISMGDREETLSSTYPQREWGWDPEPGESTALHELAKGDSWWHVEQGIPYLLSMGADPELLNEADATPLDIIMSKIHYNIFGEEAVKAMKYC